MIVMILLAVAMVKDLRKDHAVVRDDKGIEVVKAAVEHGTRHYGSDFYLHVASPHETRNHHTGVNKSAETDDKHT
ncbi:MAG: hypothetical protein ACRDSH_21810 [Pseudonocardiaceae bacterium]